MRNPDKIIHYNTSVEDKDYFFPADIQQSISEVSNVLASNNHLHVFADSTHKKNGMPNGIGIISPYADAILLPFLLRDPGCGFLTFKVTPQYSINPQWQQSVGDELDILINTDLRYNKRLRRHILQDIDLKEVLYHGLNAITERVESHNSFLDLGFKVDPEIVNPEPNELTTLEHDLLQVTNTVELRVARISDNQNQFSDYSIEDGNIIGFIHTGSNAFPTILGQRFVYNIAEYADLNHIATLPQIHQGYFGVHLSSSLGYQYWQWLNAAMNYALVNRYLIYSTIKQLLEDHFHCHVSLINDVTHAGIFEQEHYNESCIVTTRGAQPIYGPEKPDCKHNVRLIAGQRESIALLVTAGDNTNQQDHFIQHGTSYQLDNTISYHHYFSDDDRNNYSQQATQAYYNGQHNPELCIPYSFNNLTVAKHQLDIGVIKKIMRLTPMINIHSTLLKKSSLAVKKNASNSPSLSENKCLPYG